MLESVAASSKENGPAASAVVSFEAIYERYGARVLNLAYRMTGNQDAARDLAQEVWIKVFQHLPTFEARADVFTWIHRITVNHVLNHLKKEKRRRWVNLLDRSVGEVLSEEDEEVVLYDRSPAARPNAGVEDAERVHYVWQAIQSLDPKYRVPIVLFHYEEQSYQQIADTMELSMSAVVARIHRARKQLAKALGPLLDQL
jgi:RNA polymerase sigma-70 factor (ECF subfamily)